ncbi:PREDICTED: translation initiation factor IF-2-like [Chinchilla lanigera]|uniref:translation initiation factor IF-2-like n=1 Tax=Chinchilla lanigera TaxID=34839 RepID=UPI0006991623|nr:PREDICTED: translation initiation factor IF-2-like [Chinchilla lanigera]
MTGQSHSDTDGCKDTANITKTVTYLQADFKAILMAKDGTGQDKAAAAPPQTPTFPQQGEKGEWTACTQSGPKLPYGLLPGNAPNSDPCARPPPNPETFAPLGASGPEGLAFLSSAGQPNTCSLGIFPARARPPPRWLPAPPPGPGPQSPRPPSSRLCVPNARSSERRKGRAPASFPRLLEPPTAHAPPRSLRAAPTAAVPVCPATDEESQQRLGPESQPSRTDARALARAGHYRGSGRGGRALGSRCRTARGVKRAGRAAQGRSARREPGPSCGWRKGTGLRGGGRRPKFCSRGCFQSRRLREMQDLRGVHEAGGQAAKRMLRPHPE